MVKTLGFEPRNGGSIPPPASIYLRGDFMRNKFISLLLVVAVALALCVPAFAAYGTTPTYATGNYQYSYSTSSTGSADFFTALMAQLRYIYSNLNTVNTWLKSCSTYLGGISTDVNSIKLDAISIKTNTSSAATTLTNIKSDTGSIKTDVDTIESRLVTQGTTLSNIYSSVVAAATEKTQSAILTAVKSISTDGLATEKTLASADSRLATLNNKVATAENQAALLNLLDDDSYRVYQFYERNGEYIYQAIPVGMSTGHTSFLGAVDNRLINMSNMLFKLTDTLADPADVALKDATDDQRTSVTDYMGSTASGDKYSSVLDYSNTLVGGLDTGTDMDEARSFTKGLFFSDPSGPFWLWFSQNVADDLDPSGGVSAVSTFALDDDSSDDVVWVIDPTATADDIVSNFFSEYGGDW